MELTFKIDGLSPGMPVKRIHERAVLRDLPWGVQRRVEAGYAADSMDRHRQRALALAASDRAGRALDFREEPDKLRSKRI